MIVPIQNTNYTKNVCSGLSKKKYDNPRHNIITNLVYNKYKYIGTYTINN